MRMRKKKHGSLRLDKCTDLLTYNANDAFPVKKELRLEIGCGKGQFIIDTAKLNPDINFIAIEKISDVILLAMEKTMASGITNLKFIICDAVNIPLYFPCSSVDLIYLNFNDPWSKKRHYKRRLTYKDFLDIYKITLKPNGRILLKTDNRGYFDFSVGQLADNGFSVDNITYDLHNSIWNSDNIRTEYENVFAEKGLVIYRCEASLR
ncbi:MAG: tRNA (guanosine(46)-N7)-methyltransferase TrmB [Eubacteriales bacterium]|jgi:tRNA (guanine-N7-)-methyltransferase|nr:tRNA (guanosine(46)-N7)-methyltransferase TrmB [Eubacteriales bacterium]